MCDLGELFSLQLPSTCSLSAVLSLALSLSVKLSSIHPDTQGGHYGIEISGAISQVTFFSDTLRLEFQPPQSP